MWDTPYAYSDSASSTRGVLLQFSLFLPKHYQLIHHFVLFYHNFPKLSNLKILKLVIEAFNDDCLLHCAFLLKVSPLLHKFTLKEVNVLFIQLVILILNIASRILNLNALLFNG